MSKQLLEVFSTKVQEVMNDNNWNKSELARRLKLPHTAVSKWVNGQNLATGDRLTRLSVVTGKPPHWFFTDENGVPQAPDDTSSIQYKILDQKEQALLSIFNQLSDTDKLTLMVRYMLSNSLTNALLNHLRTTISNQGLTRQRFLHSHHTRQI